MTKQLDVSDFNFDVTEEVVHPHIVREHNSASLRNDFPLSNLVWASNNTTHKLLKKVRLL